MSYNIAQIIIELKKIDKKLKNKVDKNN